MCANFVSVEKVDCVHLGVDMEVPCAEHVILETVNWLISLDDVNKAEIVQKACDCE